MYNQGVLRQNLTQILIPSPRAESDVVPMWYQWATNVVPMGYQPQNLAPKSCLRTCKHGFGGLNLGTQLGTSKPCFKMRETKPGPHKPTCAQKQVHGASP